MKSVDVLNKKVFETARKLADIKPEVFIALEEYDKTRKLRRRGNKARVNFTIDPTLYKSFRAYCQKHGYKMSALIEKAVKELLEEESKMAANI